MQNLTSRLTDIQAKAEKVISNYNGALEENKALKEENSRLKNELREKQNALLHLEEKSKVTGLAKALDKEERKEVKLKINELVREVDKCIAQLNR